jgi:hypothetical protein
MTMMLRMKTTTPNQMTTSSRRSSENPTNSPHGSELSKVVRRPVRKVPGARGDKAFYFASRFEDINLK